MGWYYYSGKVVRPIMIKKGRSVSVRPNSRVEVLDESTFEFKSLSRRGLLRRTGKPKNLNVEEKPVPTKRVEDVVVKSDMAKSIAEKGVTKSKDVLPSSKIVELTDGEETLGKDLEEDKENVGDVDKAEELPLGEYKSKEGKKRRR